MNRLILSSLLVATFASAAAPAGRTSGRVVCASAGIEGSSLDDVLNAKLDAQFGDQSYSVSPPFVTMNARGDTRTLCVTVTLTK